MGCSVLHRSMGTGDIPGLGRVGSSTSRIIYQWDHPPVGSSTNGIIHQRDHPPALLLLLGVVREEGLSPTVQDFPAVEGRAGAGLSSGRAEPGDPGSSHLGTVTSLPAVSSGCFSQKNLILTKRDDRPPRAPKSRCVPQAAEQQLLWGGGRVCAPTAPFDATEVDPCTRNRPTTW